MKEIQVSREVTALKEETDSLLTFDRIKKDFIYPLHFHPEFEINFVKNAHKAVRIMGDSIEYIDDYELCLVGPNLYHVWENGKSDPDTDKREITIQFVSNIFPQELLKKDMFKAIAQLFERSERGILFSRETAIRLEPMLGELCQKKGIESFIALLQILYQLAISPDQRVLANSSFQHEHTAYTDIRIEKIHSYLIHNYNKKIRLEDAAKLLNMSPISFTRLIKQRTGKCFIDFLNEIRLGFATRLLIDTNKTISEICFDCGFNNISNFNRIFKKKQGQTPTDFRSTFSGTKIVS